MRSPLDFIDSKFQETPRVKFIYTSTELHQNIEVSLDGNETSLEALLDAFQRFLGALGISIPENFALGFVDMSDEEDEDDDQEGTKK